MDGAPGQPVPRRPRPIAPELVAAILSAVVVATIAGGVLAGGSSPVAPSIAPEATPSVIGTARPTPGVDEGAIATCLGINSRLEADRVALEAEVAASTFEPSNVARILRSVNADAIVAAPVAARLASLPASAAAGARLTTFYGDLHRLVADALDASQRNGPAYRVAANATIKALRALPALDALLEGLRDGGPSPSSSAAVGSPSPAAPSASVPPPASVPPSAGATASPTVPPSPTVSGGLQNPGFESGVGPPWELSLASSGVATWSADPTVHAGGAASARVDISVPGVERAAVAVRQGGLSIDAGSRYVATISVRAESTREVRLRIASAGGDTYATRLFTVGPEWQVLTIDSTVLATHLDAFLEVDLGRFPATTWLDDASFTQVAASGG